jgi:hypothetical protein
MERDDLLEAERLLSGGRPSGPRLDALWARVERKVAAKPAHVSVWRAWLLGGAGLGAMAAAALMLVPTRTAPVARGGDASVEGPTSGKP